MAEAKTVRKMTTPVGRLSFPSLFQAEAFEGGEPKFSCTLLFPKGTDLSALQSFAKTVAGEKWPKGLPNGFRSPFRDGDQKEPMIDGYAGHTFIRFASTNRPKVVDLNLQEIIDPSIIYAGCYVRVSCSCFAYDKAGNRGVSFGLLNVQKVKEGDAFGLVSNPDEDFFDSGTLAAEHQSFDFGANAQPSGDDPFAL
jgi:hypothetical protein